MNNRINSKWRIIEMEMWDRHFIDAEVPGYIMFDDDMTGEFQFGYVHGYINYRFPKRGNKDIVEFTWEGNDEMDPASGRGTASIENEHLQGRICFFEGDESDFKAIRETNKT